MKLATRSNPARYGGALAPFVPLPWQREAWRDKSPVLLLTGSAGGGKSRLAAEIIHGFCLHYPGTTALALRKAREFATRSVMPFLWQSVIGGPRSGVRLNLSSMTFHYPNGSTLYIGGMKDESQRESIRSIGGAGGLDVAWMEEASAFTRVDFDELSGRLRGTAAPRRQLILTTNPGGSRHWIYIDLINNHGATVHYSKAADNAHNPADYLARLSEMRGVQYQRLVLGKWVQAEGAVYDTFDLSYHVVDRPDAEMQRWILAIDEGYTNPAVILLIGIDSDGRAHVAREYYERGKLQATVVSQAQAWAERYRCAHAAVDQAAAGLIADLRNNGVNAFGVKGRILDGIQNVQNALAAQTDGRPRLTVAPTCYNTIAEFESYVWHASAAGTRDEPVKENDHAMDALRYGLLSAGGGAKLWW